MRTTSFCLALALSLAAATTVKADAFADWGRALHKKHQAAIVTVQLVIKSKISMPGMSSGQSSESRQEITGTVVDASGLTVVSLSAIDPAQLLQNISDKIKMESELADLKILLTDGTEAPAEVVLRDKDMDLAFIRPKAKPGSPVQFIDMAQSGKAEVLDPVIALNRLGNAAGRSYSASAERISAVVQRPRLFYIPDANMTTSTLGCPIFTADGKVLGIILMRATKATGTTGGSFSSQNPNYTGIILPASDVFKAQKQVPAAGEQTK